MTSAFIAPTDIIIECLFQPKFDKHVQDYRWHRYMIGFNPDYLADLARYVTEFAGRHNVRDLDTLAQMVSLARGLEGRRLRYDDLVADNA